MMDDISQRVCQRYKDAGFDIIMRDHRGRFVTFDVIAETRHTIAYCVIVRAHTMTGAGYLIRQMRLTGLDFDAADYALRDKMPVKYRTMTRRVDVCVHTEDGITMVEDVTGRPRTSNYAWDERVPVA